MNELVKRKAGRPKRGEANPDMRQSFIDAAIEILKTEGAEQVTVRKEFCDCGFAWRFAGGDASGLSTGKTLPAFREEVGTVYPRQAFTPENAAAVPCRQVLGAYIVRFERQM